MHTRYTLRPTESALVVSLNIGLTSCHLRPPSLPSSLVLLQTTAIQRDSVLPVLSS